MKDANPENLRTSISTLSSIVDLLESHYLPLLDAIEDTTGADLSPTDKEVCKALRKIVQRYSGILEPIAAQQGGLATIREHPPTPPPAVEQHVPAVRRTRSKAYDFLLLEALTQRDRFGHPIGQETLLNLATAFEPATKKGSLISKLNRWRNTKAWIEWGDPDNISLSSYGKTERDRLLALVRREGRISDIKSAFKTAWKIDVVLD